MRHMNKVGLVGVIAREPEFKTTQSGSQFATLLLKTDENRKNKDTGEWNTKSEFHNITVWNRDVIETLRNVKKWSTIKVEGKLQTRSWEKDGEKRYSTGIVVDNFGMCQFLEGPYVKSGGNNPTREPAPELKLDDDIPF